MHGERIVKILGDMQSLMRPKEAALKEIVEIDESDWFALLFTGDWHAEHLWANTKQLERDLELLAAIPHVYAIFCGDGLDLHNIAETHLGGEHENLLPPSLSRILLEYLFDIPKGKWVAAVAGCHDMWMENIADFNLIKEVMDKQGVRYLANGGTLTIRIGTREIECLIAHKLRGSSIYNTFHPCMRAIRTGECDADIVACGHHHVNALASEFFRKKQRVYIRTSTYLARTRWMQKEGYAPSLTGSMPWVVLHPTKGGFFMGQGVEALATIL